MNADKFERAERGLNGVAKKVLAAVPKVDPWPISKIVAELRRLGHSVEVNIVSGCLDTLRGQSLIREPTRGNFVQIKVKESINEPKELAMPNPMPPMRLPPSPAPAAAKKDTLDGLAAVANNLRQAADRIDALALEVEDRVQASEQDSEKLRQLQTILKSINQ